MKESKNLYTIIIGAVLTAAGIAAMIFTRTAAIAENAASTDKALYAAAIIAVLLGLILIFSKSLLRERKTDLRVLTMAAMMSALCYIGFAFFKIDIPIPGTAERTAFHLGNVFCVLAALFLGGFWGGLSGAVGMTIGDLLTGYVTSAPKTFLLKLCIGLITGFVAHRVFHLSAVRNSKERAWKTAVSCTAGMIFNVIADPMVGYIYKRFLFGMPQDFAAALAKLSAVTTLVNALVAVLVATVLYLALRPALSKANLLR